MEIDWPGLGRGYRLTRMTRVVRRCCIVSGVVLALAGSGAAWADLAGGIAAYRKGDHAGALKEFKPLASQGDATAQLNLGFMYARGEGVVQDYKTAAQWYRKAAEQGHPDAQYNLGSLYYDGLAMARDYQQAAQWYTRAAEGGQLDAQYNLGLMYATGQGVPVSMVQSYKWLAIAAALGDSEAEEGKQLAAAKMTPVQLDEAQALVAAWWAARK